MSYKNFYKVKILVDRREERSGIINLLKQYNMEVVKDTLAIGDYFVDERVLVERKTVEDFKSSLISGRLFEQVVYLKRWCDKSALIIEGDLSNLTGIDQNALQGAIVSIAVFWQIPVLFSKDLVESAKLIHIVASQLVKNRRRKGIRNYLRRKKPILNEQYSQRMLEVLPSIGPVTAENLLQHFGSVENVIQSS